MASLGDCMKLRLFIVGYPLEYTLSPPIYMEWAKRHGIPLQYDVERPSSPAALLYHIRHCRGDPCCLGFNVTMPYKAVILSLLDRIESHARVIEAVNTVYKQGTTLAGINTDWLGVRDPVNPRWPGGQALIIGAGGAARAAAYAIHGKASRILYTSRTGVTAEKLAEWTRRTLGVDSEGYKAEPEAYKRILPGSSLVINASPASGANKTPIPTGLLRLLPSQCTVMDMVYNPPETMLLREARHRGCSTIDGIQMLAVQAAYNIEAWLGEKPDPKELEEIARRHAKT